MSSAPTAPTRVAIIGASGYIGAELVRLLHGHPGVTVTVLTARRSAGKRFDHVFPHMTGMCELSVTEFDADTVAREADVAFTALPHGAAATIVAALRARGVRTLDLSADYRLRDRDVWAAWYGADADEVHPGEALLESAVYGLPERHRSALVGAQLVAVPGCYPTATILALAPLLERGLIDATGMVIDAKSGASGAGRCQAWPRTCPKPPRGFRPYHVGGAHRHTPEIEQELTKAAGSATTVLFTPHLVPMSRGILACGYATPTDSTRPVDAYRDALVEAYADEPFVSVLPAGMVPDTAHVRGSNRVHVTAVFDPRSRRVLAIAAIDNLIKGAAGQAVQCMNVALGLPETTGLSAAPLFP